MTGPSDQFPLDPTESVDINGDGVGNNADTDDDNERLPDAIETAVGADPLVEDSDGDGLDDGVDVEFVQDALRAVPVSAFKSPGTSSLGSFLARLDDVEELPLRGNVETASKKLFDLRLRVDGCGARSDSRAPCR